MIKTVLFDLDGTLLHLEQEEFAREYFLQLGMRIAPVIEPKQFIKQLLSSTKVMVENRDRNKTNQQIFFEDFFSNVGFLEEKLIPIINNFYEHDFVSVRHLTRNDSAAHKAVTMVIQQGLDAVVATNPIFPMTAIRQRLDWAGLGDVPFKLVTSYEECHFCKPNPDYYIEIAERIGCQPNECLMVGNDVEEDLIAASVGMKTYLVTDHLINTKNVEPKADYIGSLSEMAESIGTIIKQKN